MAVRAFGIPAILCFVLLSCGESPEEVDAGERSVSKVPGFEATITGAYEGKVSGSGVLKWLPAAAADGNGFYFLADGQGVRQHGVTFVLPPGTRPGRHELRNPAPLEIGTVPSVRVDRDLGNATVSADRNTSGYLNLTAFPESPDSRGADVRGNFDFETEDREGRRIRVKGRFSFTAG